MPFGWFARAPDGSSPDYQWSVDEGASFPFDTGQERIFRHAFSQPGTYHVIARATSGAWSATASTSAIKITAAPPSPDGPQGVSIDDGAQYTNSPTVQLYANWLSSPGVICSDAMVISNDGGFRNAVTRPIAGSVPWKLDSSGAERLPKTVYVRFRDFYSHDVGQTFQDDIILDETDPVVSSASTDSPAVAAAARASASTVRTAVVRVKASDKLSGVKSMQITSSRRHPGKVLQYHRSVRVKAARHLYVRVRDRAGNWSRWRQVRRAH
jgi:hypothetical protein